MESYASESQVADFASLLRHSNSGYEGRVVAWLRRLKELSGSV
jgi:hypothetical protein